MHADLFEDTAFHHRHLAAAALAIVAQPVLLHESSGLLIGQRAGQIVFEGFEGGDDGVAQMLEPGLGNGLLVFDVLGQALRQDWPFHA